jgi:hypothetical protein
MDLKEEKQMLIKHDWLIKIAKDYKKHIKLIEQEKEFFVVNGIKFSARGPVEDMEINPHMTIPYEYILEGLKDALAKVRREIDFIEDVFRPIMSNK